MRGMKMRPAPREDQLNVSFTKRGRTESNWVIRVEITTVPQRAQRRRLDLRRVITVGSLRLAGFEVVVVVVGSISVPMSGLRLVRLSLVMVSSLTIGEDFDAVGDAALMIPLPDMVAVFTTSS